MEKDTQNLETAQRWNNRYAGTDGVSSPALVLSRYAHLLPQQGVALDLACGLGGNALFLARQGLETHAWDIAGNAIARLEAQASEDDLQIQTQTRDVVSHPPEPDLLDVLVVTRFLDRSLVDAMVAALRPQGVIFYQTFILGNKGGPSNPDYLLKPNELLSLFSDLTVRAFEDPGNCGRQDQGLRGESLLVAQKPSPATDSKSSSPVQRTEKGATSVNQVDTFEAMLARGQDSEMLRFTLGNAYWKDKQLEKAEEHLQQAVLLKADYSAAWKVLGRVLIEAEKPEQARAALLSGIEVAEKNGDKQSVKEMSVFLRRVEKTLAQD